MSTSKHLFSLFGSSILRHHNRTLNFIPPIHFRFTHKIFLASSSSSPLRSHRCISSTAELDPTVLVSDIAQPSGSSPSPDSLHPWPEWVAFVDRLKTKGYLKESSSSPTYPPPPEREETGGDGYSKTAGVIYADVNLLKDACLSFARDRFDIFKSLSRQDIQTIVEKGCPNLFRKAVNSAKRLRAHLQLDEGDVCSVCNLRGSCDRAYVILKDSESAARTVDIVRLLLLYASDPVVFSEGQKAPGREHIEASARKLISELIELSETIPEPILPKPALPRYSPKSPEKKKDSLNLSEEASYQNVEMKRGDWMCSECNFLNFARNIRCLKCKADGPKRVSNDVEMKKGDWNCPGCGFMNFAGKTKCLRCRELRPERTLNPGEWECPSCDYLNYRRNTVCKKCNCERPSRTEITEKREIWRKAL